MLRFIVHCIRLAPSNERPNKKKHFQKRLHCVVFRCACMFSLRCSYFCFQIKSTSVSATCCLSSYHGVKYKTSEKDAESVRQGKTDIQKDRERWRGIDKKTAQTKELTKLFKTYNVWSFFGYNKMHMRIIAMAAIYRNKTHAYASSDKKKFHN